MELEQNQEQKACCREKHCPWMFILGIAAIALIITTACVIFYSNYSASDTPCAACNEIEECEDATSDELVHYSGTGLLPAFDVPVGHHVYAVSAAISDSKIYIDDKPIQIISESEGPKLKISITAFDNTEEKRAEDAWLLSEPGNSYIDAMINVYKNNADMENVQTSELEAEYADRCVNISGNFTTDDRHITMYPGEKFEYHICESENYVVNIKYFDYEHEPTYLENLDFSGITRW